MGASQRALINYFNYFTEIEEHFQKARGTSLFLLSPLDWALVESWKNSDVPLEAVLRGIDAAFEKWRSRRVKTQQVNSLAFCAQAVLMEAQRRPESASSKPAAPPFPADELQRYLRAKAAQFAGDARFSEVAAKLEELAVASHDDLEALEQQLTVMEQKVFAIIRASQSDAEALQVRRELEAQLRPYRGKMTAPQLAMLEQQYLDRALLESNGLPRLSLFYLR